MQRYKTITCVVPSGHALELLERLRAERGMTSAYAHHARDVAAHTSSRGQTIADESELVTVLVAAEEADQMFEFLHQAAGIGEPEGGLIFMERTLAARASPAPGA